MKQEKGEKAEELLNLQQETERCKLEKEKLSCELAEISGRNLNNEAGLKSRNESLQKMVHLLESQLEREKGKLEGIEKEFESYKVRAQSVLRKEKESVVGAKAQEVAALERLTQSLNEKITGLRYFSFWVVLAKNTNENYIFFVALSFQPRIWSFVTFKKIMTD